MEKVENQSTDTFKLSKALYLHTEGEILWRNIDYKKALESLQLSLTFSEELLKEHTDLARCYNAIGNCYSRLNQPMEALEFYEKAYNMQESLAGSEYHFDMPMYKHQIGTAYEGLQKYDKAVECYRDALKLLKELNLSALRDEAHFCREIANALLWQGKYSEAAEPALRAYNIRKKLLKNHPHTVRSIFQRAILQAYLQDYEGALKLFLEAWEMEKSLDIGNHSEVWQKIITGAENMCDFLEKEEEKQTFRKDAFKFCEHFWIEKKKSPRFAFVDSNKDIIDALMDLVSDENDKYEFQKEQLWFYEGMYNATKEELQKDCYLETESDTLHYMLEEMTKLLNQMIHLCHRLKDYKQEELYTDELQAVKDGRVPEVTSHSKAPEEEKSLEVEEFSSRSTDPDGRQKEEAARNVDERKTVIKRGKIVDESETWNLAKAGASITFNLGAITKSLTITCSLWTPAALSPPIGSNELLVSNVIELSHDGPPDLEFMENDSGSIDVALLHSASNFKGYEVVIKQLVDSEYNEWEDLETKNIWHSSVNPTVPNWTCPSAEASCSKRWFSSFAAVWCLKSFVFPKPTSKTSEFICSLPDYPNVSVAIPWNSLPADTDFSLTLKVQEAPTIDHDVEGMFVGPILHISCSNNVTLSAPAKISLPLALTDGGIEPAELHSGQVKILHFNSREESQEWTDITDHLDMPVVLRGGIVTFHVKTFCRFWPWLLKTSASIPWKYASLLCDGIMKHQAGFLACLCNDVVPSRYVLNMFCFPQQLRSLVNSDISSTYCVNMQGEGTSKKPLSSGDETCVSLSNGFEVQGAGNVEDIVLKFHSEHHAHEFLRVSIKDPSDLQVDFLKLLGGKERNDFPIICKVPIIPRSPTQGHVPATFDPEEESSISAQSVKHSIVKHSKVESSSSSLVAAHRKRKRKSTGISAQSVKHSVVKHPNVKSSSHSLLTAPRKKICQSAGIYLVKDGKPLDEELQYLSRELAGKWKTLGRRLGFNEAAIDDFDQANKELVEKAYKMLMAWKQKVGCEATYKVLYDTLCHKLVECKLLAEQYCCDEIVGNDSP